MKFKPVKSTIRDGLNPLRFTVQYNTEGDMQYLMLSCYDRKKRQIWERDIYIKGSMSFGDITRAEKERYFEDWVIHKGIITEEQENEIYLQIKDPIINNPAETIFGISWQIINEGLEDEDVWDILKEETNKKSRFRA